MQAKIDYFGKYGALMTCKSIWGSKKIISRDAKKLAYYMDANKIIIEYPDNTNETYIKKGLLWFKQ